MCGRYAASAELDELVEEFDIDDDRHEEVTRSVLANPQDPPAGTADWNMAPAKQAPVVLTRASATAGSEPTRQLRLLTWGLVPNWAKEPSVGSRMINTRADTVASKPVYARPLAARRALVPAAGWYEWQVSPTATDAKGKPRKQPFYVARADGTNLAMAGLYEFWRDRAIADGDDPDAWLVTFTIITTDADPGLDRIHHRQPLVLEREDWARWLDPTVTDPAAVADLVAFADPGRFVTHPVSRAVGSNRANGPQLTEPIPASDLVGVLDPVTGEIIG